MSTPTQFGPPQQSGGGGSTVLVVILVVLGILVLICGGLCAGCVIAVRLGTTAAQKGIQEGFKFAQLDPAYVEAQQAVTADQQVIDRLGEPIETVASWEREAEGDLQAAGETFQFDIKGPKGTGIVSVVATRDGDVFKARKITVTFADGTVVVVPPPGEDSLPAEAQPKP